MALTNLGIGYSLQSREREATEHSRQTLAIAQDMSDRRLECFTLTNVGIIHCREGRYQQATEYIQRALTIARDNDVLKLVP